MAGIPITHDDLDNRFAYHKPDEQKIRSHEHVRESCFLLAHDIVDLCPPGRETSLAITHVEDAMMWANAAIARGD